MIENYILKAISDKNIDLVRSSIITEVNSNRKNEYNNILSIVHFIGLKLNDEGLELFDTEDGQYQIIDDRSKWTEDLWTEVKVELGYNFSKEKIEFLIKIMEFLRKSGHPDFKLIPSSNPENKDDSHLKTGILVVGASVIIITIVVIIVNYLK
ncbi:MAG: hypothetical protein B6I17_03615 [Tenericutes bacterium 4572_104]|nr:MAG: hypothetical protein B6I17_03615 [Tenericutes bacterium 4572_104]